MRADTATDGQYICLYRGPKASHVLRYHPGRVFHTKDGAIELGESLSFGDVVTSHTGVQFHVLRPNTSQLMFAVKRQTTIVYPKDAGLILLELGITAGMHIAEVGSGSGALSVVFSRIIGNEGRVFSFERRHDFHRLARRNHRAMSPFENVEFEYRDVAQEGFGDITVDALFIDVPEPWDIVPAASRVLRPGASVGSICPNVEQVHQTCTALEEHGFIRIRSMETMLRELRVRPQGTSPEAYGIKHTGYLVFAELAGQA